MSRPTRNEYGTKLDKNGYAPSLFVHESFCCFRCHRFGDTARHEIYGGALRSKSKQYGLWINVGSTSAPPAMMQFTPAERSRNFTTNWVSSLQWPTITGQWQIFAAAFIKTISILRRINLY